MQKLQSIILEHFQVCAEDFETEMPGLVFLILSFKSTIFSQMFPPYIPIINVTST